MDMGGKVIIVSMSIPIISGLLETIIKVLPWQRSEDGKSEVRRQKYKNHKMEDILLNK